MIPEHSRGNFVVNENDTSEQALNKLYQLDKDKIDKQMKAEKALEDFTKKYAEIKKLKGKNTIEQLELQLAYEELFGNQ